VFEPVEHTASGFPLGVEEHRSGPIFLDLARPGAHFVVYADPGAGRTTLLRRVIGHLGADRRDQPTDERGANAGRALVHLVDPARTLLDLAELSPVASYAYERQGTAALAAALAADLGGRLPPPGLPPSVLARRGWWSGPEHVLVIDDHDQLLVPDGSPLGPLADLVSSAADLGWHVVVARPVTGSGRTAYDPFTARLREQCPTVLVMAGDAAESRLLAGSPTAGLPPGRGLLTRPGCPTALVQAYLPRSAAAASP
jgi:S-DNA-T family DNA segregation ATPase FtsK/SpoIIIE